jgi:lysophospholipase L1-like esterase
MIQKNDTILFQGDSITDAFRRPEEINNCYQLGSGYAFLAASRISLKRPADGLTFLNRGISGNTSTNILSRWKQDCLDLKPDFLSLLAGVNDTLQSRPTKETLESFEKILETTRAVLPRTRILICEPFLLPCENISTLQIDDVREKAAGIRKIATSYGIDFLNLQDPLDMACAQSPSTFWAYDGIHPTAAGAALIAQEWLQRVSSELPH